MAIEVKYDEQIEVTKEKYHKLMLKCQGIVAGREEDGKYYIKVWMPRYASIVESILNS